MTWEIGEVGKIGVHSHDDSDSRIQLANAARRSA